MSLTKVQPGMVSGAGSLPVTATGGTASRTLAARFADVVNVRDFGAVGDGVADDTAAVQAAVTYACANGKTLVGAAGRHRITAPVTYGTNFTYRGDGAWFVKDFVSTGYQDALFTNSGYNTTTRTENVLLRDLWLTDTDSTKYGTFLTLVTGKNVLIDGLVTIKRGESWTTAIAADNLRITNANMYTAAGKPFGDCIHVTQGSNIVIDNCTLENLSDDGIAIHGQQAAWGVNGQFDGIDNVVISSCTIKSATNSVRVGMSETGGVADGDSNSRIGRVTVQGCHLVDGAQLLDDRTTISGAPTGPVIFDSCTFNDDLLVRGQANAVRYGRLLLNNCTFQDVGTGLPIDVAAGLVDELRVTNCVVTGHTILSGATEVTITGTRFKTATTGNAVAVNSPRAFVRDSQLFGSNTEFRGFFFNNGGVAVPFVALQNCYIADVARGMSTTDGITFLNVEGTEFSNTPTSTIGGTVTTLRGSLSGSVVYDPPSIAAAATVTTTVTVTGAVAGDPVVANFTPMNSSLSIDAWISAANTATVRFRNDTASAVDAASGTIRVRVFRS